MIRRFRRLSRRLPGSEAGFTLVELLVVVGVIVALAAVIVPSVVKFSGKGETGAKAAEGENVQAAIDTMLADKGITGVTGLSTADNSTQVWTALPTGTGTAPLDTYLRDDTTAYFYCYDSTGKVSRQDTVATACP